MDTLEFRDAVRILLQNALDEARAGHCQAIDLELSHDAIRVRDDGRGLPVHPHPTSGRSLLEVIMTGPRRGPKNTLALLNSSSLWIDVEVHRDGELWFQRFEFARPVDAPRKRGTAVRRGTTITCAPARGEPPTFEDMRELVQLLSRDAAGVKAKVRIRDSREARDETIVIA